MPQDATLDVNYQGPFGNTLLHSAVAAGSVDEVQKLLSLGADPCLINRYGQTPCEVARVLGRKDIEQLLPRPE
jgi:ankyrin repeat protein